LRIHIHYPQKGAEEDVMGGFLSRYRENQRIFGDFISDTCRELGVPDVPFDMKAAVREVLAGRRPGVLRDGQWWVASGLEHVGNPRRMRLLEECALPDEAAVVASIENLFDFHAGRSPLPPYLNEGRYVGGLLGVSLDVIHANITGRWRPIGGWLVAVPPRLIGSKR
jgi:hypothetical protein